MFWGLIMEPNKRYTQTVEKPFHISQAAMDTSTGDTEPCQVMVVVEDKNYLICTLQKSKIIQVPLDLYFKTGNIISFLTNGKCNVHLTGYLDPEFEEESGEEEEEEEEDDEEVPPLVQHKNKRKLEKQEENMVAKKKFKKEAKKLMGKDSSSEDDEDDDDDDDEGHLQKLLGSNMDSDENDESFKINTSGDASDSDEEDSDNEEEEENVNAEKESSEEEAETTLDTSKDSKGDEKHQKLSRSQKRRLKKKMQQQQGQMNGVEKPKKQKQEVQEQKKEKKEANKQDGKAEKREKKSLSGGVMIEDIKVGDGPLAKAGKIVQVYYEGRLKSNNKMFDNCNKGPGFKFRLGSKEVISGWDIGVAGMKVGGKRKIICPPAMAYGAKGSPPVIPPNSTLVFEVELKNIK